MKKGVHPTYYPQAKISCACGNTIVVGSTKEKTEVEICSACHPFYTGKEKLIDTAGRVERFEQRRKAAADRRAKPKAKAVSSSSRPKRATPAKGRKTEA